MNRLILPLAALLLTSVANAKSVECADLDDSRFMVTVNFDSDVPLLTSLVTTLKPDGSVEYERKTEHLTSKKACDMTVDFSTDCTSKEKQGPLGYTFDFKCKSKNLSGEFYVDEFGSGTFSCSNSPRASVFFDCKIR